MADPDARFSLAFDQPTLEPDPDWTPLDTTPNLVVSYQIDRGRQYELDRTDAGRATVEIIDTEGVLDPTNVDSPYFNHIEPLTQALIRRRNPVDDTWYTRFRGFVEDFSYEVDPSQQLNRLTVTLVDIFELLSGMEMLVGQFGDDPGDAYPDAADQIWFARATMQDRINQVLDNAGIPLEFRSIFSGNVRCRSTTYANSESAMTCVQEAADSEFPGVANVFTDKLGRLAVHGRLARFDPAGTHASAAPGVWDWHAWHAGDSTAVAAAPATTAHVRRFSFDRGLSKIINQAFATPKRDGLDIPFEQLTRDQSTAQIVTDAVSISRYGLRSWSAQDLLTQHGLTPTGTDTTNDLEETFRFAQYYVQNFAIPQNRVTEFGLRTIHPDATGAAATWRMLSLVDISDTVELEGIATPGGGFSGETFMVEGVHETVRPLNPDYDDIELSLDLSPRQYFDSDPWEPGP